jgi:hypothetical protein
LGTFASNLEEMYSQQPTVCLCFLQEVKKFFANVPKDWLNCLFEKTKCKGEYELLYQTNCNIVTIKLSTWFMTLCANSKGLLFEFLILLSFLNLYFSFIETCE